MKIHWKKLHNPDYLGAYSLQDGQNKELIVEIASVEKKAVKGSDGKDQECIVAHMTQGKPMIINPTNAKTISKIAKSPYIEDWQGVRIQLYVKQIKAFGEVVDALRIRPNAPAPAKLPELTPSHEAWDKCKKAISKGFTLDQIKSKYSITPENAKLLCAK